MAYPVKEAMRKHVVTIDEDASTVEAAKLMSEGRSGCVIVLRAGKPVGIVTENNLTLKVISKGLEPDKVKIKDVMTSRIISVDPDVDLYEAVRLMTRHNIRRLPVIRDDVLYGILGPRELAHHFSSYADRRIVSAISRRD